MNVEPAGLFARTEGQAGAAVVCLHSSTGSHAQWRGLAGQLALHCRVISFDLHGHGRSPDWPATADRSLLVDAQAVSAHMHAESGIHLVAHSYGAAVAMQIALRHPKWVRSLALYEPVVFGVIQRLAPGDAALGEVEVIAAGVRKRVARGKLAEASALFVDYWGGAGTWRSLDAAQQAIVMSRIGTVPNHFGATFAATWGGETLSRLTMPVLLMHGSSTRASSRRVADLLAARLPQVMRRQFVGAGHLGPVTHDAFVNREIAAHLARHAPGLNTCGVSPQPALT